MIAPEHIRLISFDCYGTLVDWEHGILAALRPLLAGHGAAVGDAEILAAYGELESQIQRGAYRPYREVLEAVVDGFGRRYGFEPAADERAVLVESIGRWPLFADVPAALDRLRRGYKLAVLSNIDDALFAPTGRRLGFSPDSVVTAEQVHSYKPAAAHFEAAAARFGVSAGEWLHVGQSLYHDIAPASRLGIATVWIDRYSHRTGSGATPPAQARPDMTLPDLRALADRLDCRVRGNDRSARD